MTQQNLFNPRPQRPPDPNPLSPGPTQVAVLGTALAIKMVAYVGVAPVAAAFGKRHCGPAPKALASHPPKRAPVYRPRLRSVLSFFLSILAREGQSSSVIPK
jgi:hypothetical protein